MIKQKINKENRDKLDKVKSKQVSQAAFWSHNLKCT